MPLAGPRMTALHRQGLRYLVVGGVQWLLDCGVTIALSHGGLAIEAANLCGRVSGALLGFWLNGRYTFGSEGARIGRTQLRRFLTMWICTTAISTLALGRIDALFGLGWAWLAKPALVVLLAAVGFVLSRQWIYRD